MTKGIIYYTDNRLSEPIFSLVQDQIKKSDLPITSITRSPILFGTNYTVSSSPGYLTMLHQITLGLQKATQDYVFFCEHDVLYPQSHFDFIPPTDNIFYYNDHIWRWDYPTDRAITYDRLICLSGLCVNRLFALAHYESRLKKIAALGLRQDSHEPIWARRWGYEPGTKKTTRGGFSDDDFSTWHSKDPLIDIRHSKTFSPPKVTLTSFKHLPTGWRETSLDRIPGWNVKSLFPNI